MARRVTPLSLLLSSVLFLIYGCASMQPRETMLLQQSRFGELEQYMETEIKDPQGVPFHKLFYLCYAQSKVRRYDKLFPCLDQLQRKVDAGDYKLFVFDFRSAPSLLRAVAWIELGDYEKALQEAKTGYHLAKTYKTYLQMWIYALSAVGLANALAGDRPEAEKFAAELEGVSTSYPHTLLTKDKVIGLARIYMALGDYPRALKAIRRDKDSAGLAAFADLVSGASLTRGFLYAGAGSLVTSLWIVDDRATSELMKHFYEGLRLRSKRDALREAQLFVKEKYPHPFYWAAFQLTGNAR